MIALNKLIKGKLYYRQKSLLARRCQGFKQEQFLHDATVFVESFEPFLFLGKEKVTIPIGFGLADGISENYYFLVRNRFFYLNVSPFQKNVIELEEFTNLTLKTYY